MSKEEIVKNSFESKCDIKIETNSRGYNKTVHVYEGVTKEQIDDTVFKAMYANETLDKELVSYKKLKEREVPE